MLKVKLRGSDIRKILARKNLSQNWLAKRLCISSGYMAQILNGDKHPSPKVRERIQNYFKELEFDDLFNIRKK